MEARKTVVRFPVDEKCGHGAAGKEVSMAVLKIDGNNFEEKILNAQGTAVVDFWADWCGPCRMFSPIIEQLAAEHPELTVGKINVDENPQLAEKYRVMGIPTLLVFRDGKVAATSVGVKPQKALEGMIG